MSTLEILIFAFFFGGYVWDAVRVTMLDRKVERYRRRCDDDWRVGDEARAARQYAWQLGRYGELPNGEFC